MAFLFYNLDSLWSSAGLFFLYFLPIPLAILCWRLYKLYIQTDYIHKMDWLMLEVKIPREILKSPQAMEVALSGLHQPGEGSLIDQYIKGRIRTWFSLEMISLGGSVRFFIRTEKKFKELIESQLYSQYPGVEIFEADDYTQFVPYGAEGSNWSIFGAELQFTKADPYPIKTYIDYGLDKDPKEEFKIDPLTPVMELLGSIGPNEQLWIQIPVMATKDRFKKPDTWFGVQNWRDEGQKLVKEIMEKHAQKDKDGNKMISELSVPKSDRDVIEAINRSISKLGFDCGIRLMYLAPEDKFQAGNIARMLSVFKQFGSLHLNGFKPLRTTSFDYPWQNPFGFRLAALKRKMFESYRRRAYFYWPYRQKPMVLNTEELATIFHFPGQVAETPTLERIESKRGEPPPNLPVQGIF